MTAHHETHPKVERQFSASLDELRRDEEQAGRDIEAAKRRAEGILLKGREDAQAVVGEARKKAAEERQKIIDAELGKIEAECAKIVEKAGRDAARLRSEKEPKKVASKILPLVLRGGGAD